MSFKLFALNAPHSYPPVKTVEQATDLQALTSPSDIYQTFDPPLSSVILVLVGNQL